MAVLFSSTSQNWSAAGWKTVDTTSYLLSEAGNTSTTTSYVTSQTFTHESLLCKSDTLQVTVATAAAPV